MISVLIPVYNYNIINLVTDIFEQISKSNIVFEIICIDDCSETEITSANRNALKPLKYITYKVANKNKGRTQTRQQLAKYAKYDWLLFLDADVKPKNKEFINNYIQYIDNIYDAIFGGFMYENNKPHIKNRLRWKYGKSKEEKAAELRNKKPYKIIISGNFLIKKELFLLLNSKIQQNRYGLDSIFGAKLKEHHCKVFHIDNEVLHLGLEDNITYLKKKQSSVLALLDYYKSDIIKSHQNDLLYMFNLSKQFRFNYIFASIFWSFGQTIKKNLTGNSPSILLLQLYKISFMCYYDLRK